MLGDFRKKPIDSGWRHGSDYALPRPKDLSSEQYEEQIRAQIQGCEETLCDLWRARAATSPKSLAQVLLSEVVVDAVRKELRRQTNYTADFAKVHGALRDELLRAEILS